MATWRELISKEMKYKNDDWSNVVSCTLSTDDMNKEFNDGFGWSKGVPFTLWTIDRVYFPAVYDGAEWVASVARNPDGKPTNTLAVSECERAE